MHHECKDICFCPLKGIIDVISKKWALLIINAIGNHGKLRFKELMDGLSGISPKTLSDTLKDLEAEGLIKRESFAEIPPRVEYTLTEDGNDLREAIIPLLRWTATRSTNKHKCNSLCERIPDHIIKEDVPTRRQP